MPFTTGMEHQVWSEVIALLFNPNPFDAIIVQTIELHHSQSIVFERVVLLRNSVKFDYT